MANALGRSWAEAAYAGLPAPGFRTQAVLSGPTAIVTRQAGAVSFMYQIQNKS